MNSSKATPFLIVILLISVIANYVFDWQRRSNFTDGTQHFRGDAQTAIASVKSQAEEVLGSVRASLLEHRHLFDTLQATTSSLLESNNSLHNIVIQLQQRISQQPTDGTQGLTTDPDPIHNLQHLFATPVETMLNDIAALSRNPEAFNIYSPLSLDSPDRWALDNLLSDLSAEFKVGLTEEERQLLNARITTYRDLAQAAWANYRASISIAKTERFIAADYDTALPDGSYSTTPNTFPDDVFSVTLEENKRFRWTKTDHPSEYQGYLVAQYVPLLMVNDIRGRFQRKAQQ